MTKLELAIIKSPTFRSFVSLTKKVYPAGFEGLSLYEVGGFFFREVQNYKLNERSAAVTYNFLMAIPPTLLFLFSLLPYLPLGDVQRTITTTIIQVMPRTAPVSTGRKTSPTPAESLKMEPLSVDMEPFRVFACAAIPPPNLAPDPTLCRASKNLSAVMPLLPTLPAVAPSSSRISLVTTLYTCGF